VALLEVLLLLVVLLDILLHQVVLQILLWVVLDMVVLCKATQMEFLVVRTLSVLLNSGGLVGRVLWLNVVLSRLCSPYVP
jgi:hypothetical protein